MIEHGLTEIQINLLCEAPIWSRYFDSPALGALIDLINKGFIIKLTGSHESSPVMVLDLNGKPYEAKRYIFGAGETRYVLTDKGRSVVALLKDV